MARFKGQLSGKKVLISGNVIEIYEYQKPILYDHKNDNTKKVERPKNIKEGEEKAENKKKAVTTARNKIRRLANENFKSDYDKFITITFKENIQNLSYTNKEFRLFIMRLKRRYGNFRYLAVMEKQERGAIHYHLIMDYQPKMDFEELRTLFPMGTVNVQCVRDKEIDNVGAYLIKYVTKDLSIAENSQKNYLCSKGLAKPKTIYGQKAFDITKAMKKENIRYANEYDSKLNGSIKYLEYNISSIS